MTPYGEIYVVTCSVNGKQYVGQTTGGAKKRWREHRNDARKGRGYLLCRAIEKYGVVNFSIEVVDTSHDQDGLDLKEKCWIQRLGSRTPSGYNLAEGGSGGKLAPETIEKIRQNSREIGVSPQMREASRIANTGRKNSPESRKKMSLAKLGKKPSPQAFEAALRANTGRVKSPEERAAIGLRRLGKKHTPETLEKMRLAKLGGKKTPEQRANLIQAMRSPETRERLIAGQRRRRERESRHQENSL